ncbi:MAG: DUF3187 family protein [Pseudomonadales bacterium]
MKDFLYKACCIGALWGLSAPLWAAVSTDPIPYRNVSPMAQIIGLPRFSGGRLLPHGTTKMRLIAETANDFSSGGNLAEDAVSLDGETSVFTVNLRHGILEWLEVGVEIPYVMHSSGGMDPLVDGWHDVFNLPDSGRTNASSNEFSYQLVLGGQPALDLQSRTGDIGDIRVLIASSLMEGDRSLAARGSIKFPTGDEEDLIGSDSTEIAISMAYTDLVTMPANMVLTAEAGFVGGEDDGLLGRQEQTIVFGGVALVYPRNNWAFKGQVTGHTRLYESSLSHLGDWALQGALGVAWHFAEHFELEGSVIEDLKADTTSDVTFQLMLTTTF